MLATPSAFLRCRFSALMQMERKRKSKMFENLLTNTQKCDIIIIQKRKGNKKMENKNEYGAIINLTRMLNQTIEETKATELRHLANPRCKRPDFSSARYALGRLAEREGLPEPSLEETERLIRMAW
jgi:hypothetical protein